LYEILQGIVNAKTDFSSEEFADFLTWFKHSFEHRVNSEEEVEQILTILGEGDVNKMKYWIDYLIDNKEEDGYIKAAVQMLKKGKSLKEVIEVLDLTYEQIKMVEERMAEERAGMENIIA